jgi:hypothetical protein
MTRAFAVGKNPRARIKINAALKVFIDHLCIFVVFTVGNPAVLGSFVAS